MVSLAPNPFQIHPATSSSSTTISTLFFLDSLCKLHTRHRTRLPLLLRRASSSFPTSTPLPKLYRFRIDSLHRQNTPPPPQPPKFHKTEEDGEEHHRRHHRRPGEPPPWIEKWSRTPPRTLPRRPLAVLDYRHGGTASTSDDDEDVVGTSRSTGTSTMERIVEKLKKFGYIDDVDTEVMPPPPPERGSVEDIFYAEDGVLPDARGGLSWDLMREEEEMRFPWEKRKEEDGEGSLRRRSRTSLAELTLPEGELRRLRHLAIRSKSKTKIGGAGVTREVVEKIREKWQTEEVVRLKCEGPPALNMKRMHEILERKTGGLVIWRSGSSISLYRGLGCDHPQPEKSQFKSNHVSGAGPLSMVINESFGNPIEDDIKSDLKALREDSASSVEKKNGSESSPEIKYEHEVDKLLDGLGPRYTDWPGSDPLPVDADLLPGIVPGYKPPFRVLPYGVRPTLGVKEATALRRLARTLPPHFALGRNRQHQGLAVAMAKLWERSSIAKIALKRGVQLTSSERMAADIKKLTGATILSRNKDYIVFYRGKDFLSREVSEALLERERLAKALQDEEEHARLRAFSSVISNIETVEDPGATGTLGETLEADARWGKRLDDDDRKRMMRAAEVARHADLVRKLERKLSLSEHKLMKAEKALSKVEEFLKPVESRTDPESISDEERFMFRKLGLRMKAFLLLGRRGVFDGTVENMHLHWKYRELVKIVVKAKNFAQVRSVALSLEAESGGILVSVDKISKGFAVIVYRGKDYQRPRLLRPKNLLTKRKALARSIELQRREALLRHVSSLHKRVEQLKYELGRMDAVKDHGDEDLYSKMDAAYMTENEDAEDEGDEAYLETFDSAIDDDNDEDDKASSQDAGDEAYLETLSSAIDDEDEASSQDEGDEAYFETLGSAIDDYDDEDEAAKSHDDCNEEDSVGSLKSVTNFHYNNQGATPGTAVQRSTFEPYSLSRDAAEK